MHLYIFAHDNLFDSCICTIDKKTKQQTFFSGQNTGKDKRGLDQAVLRTTNYNHLVMNPVHLVIVNNPKGKESMVPRSGEMLMSKTLTNYLMEWMDCAGIR